MSKLSLAAVLGAPGRARRIPPVGLGRRDCRWLVGYYTEEP